MFSPVTWLAAAIRLFTGVRYNHAGVVVENWGTLFINEALGNGIRARPLKKYLHRPSSSYLILRPKNPYFNERFFAVTANDLLGTKYGFKDIFYQAWYRVTGVWHGRTEAKAANAMVCTEYVAYLHGLRQWWKYSAKELLESKEFEHYKLYEPPQDK